MEKVSCLICEKDKSSPYINLTDRLTQNPERFQLVKCECDFVYLNPRPYSQDISAYYLPDQYDPHHSTNNNIWSNIYHFVQWFTLRWKYNKISKTYKSGRLLDIGGGKGEFASFMTSKGWEVVLQDRFIGKDENKISGDYKFVQDLKMIKDNEYFDVITLWHSLEHIHDIKELYKQINRMLMPDGMLLIAVPNLQAPERRLYGENWAPFDTPRHLYHFQPNSLKRLCNKYKFKIVRKYSLFQDTPYNILLSISRNNLFQILKGLLIFFYSIFQNIFKGPEHSSSLLVICRRS